jgi:hypothetical protein
VSHQPTDVGLRTEVRDLYICTSVFTESVGSESTYAQVPGSSSSSAFQAVYWRCALVLIASSYRHQPELRHIVFTDTESVPIVDGVDIGAFLRSLGVEVAVLPATFIPPPKHYPAWRGCFYKFDVMRELHRRMIGNQSAIVLDTDCVWVGGAGPLEEALTRDGLLTYVLSYPVDWRANGLTREEMRQIATEFSGVEVVHPLVYCGGELIAATGDELSRIVPEIDVAWRELIDRCGRGERRFNTEEHVLSYVYHRLRYPLGNGDPFIRRIWTGSFGTFNNALPTDHGLLLWHVPMEKRLGLRRLFREVVDPNSPFWTLSTGSKLREYLASYLGVPHNSPRKLGRDLTTRVVDRIRHR